MHVIADLRDASATVHRLQFYPQSDLAIRHMNRDFGIGVCAVVLSDSNTVWNHFVTNRYINVSGTPATGLRGQFAWMLQANVLSSHFEKQRRLTCLIPVVE